MTRGGKRKGAGRPKGGEPTKAIRLPISVIAALEEGAYSKLPLYLSKVTAGFPSPAEDYVAEHLDLHQFLVKHPTATFLLRATGDSMVNAGIHENDILIVDRSITPTPGKIVIAAIDGQLTVKRLHKNQNGKFSLLPENPQYLPIDIPDQSDLMIWGVVIHVIHTV